jgi:hypothetical protein
LTQQSGHTPVIGDTGIAKLCPLGVAWFEDARFVHQASVASAINLATGGTFIQVEVTDAPAAVLVAVLESAPNTRCFLAIGNFQLFIRLNQSFSSWRFLRRGPVDPF